MNSETQTYFNVAIAIFGGLGGWILNNLRDNIRSLQTADSEITTKLQSIEVLVAGSYVKRDEMDRLAVALFQKLDRIESKLDSKADKETCTSIHTQRSSL